MEVIRFDSVGDSNGPSLRMGYPPSSKGTFQSGPETPAFYDSFRGFGDRVDFAQFDKV
ncbi:MAG: hypothetical protein KDD45_10690 [Bdellovibrionales bacterium]|nr:hypothetical protein [Bdellovibrionales bacterium]